MIDKRSAIGKMIDGTKVVYHCIKCKIRFVGDINTDIKICPSCKHTDSIVIDGNLIVRK